MISIKKSIKSKLYFRPQYAAVGVTNKRKTIKKASFGLITKFTITKSNSIQVLFF